MDINNFYKPVLFPPFIEEEKYLCPTHNSKEGCVHAIDYKIGEAVIGIARYGDFYCRAIEGTDKKCSHIISLNNQKKMLMGLINMEVKLGKVKNGNTLSELYSEE